MQSKWDLLALIATGCVLVTSALVKTDEAHAEPLRVTVAVSCALPDETLLSLSQQSEALSARLVVKGLPLTDEEKAVLSSRGHFAVSQKIQEQNRSLVRTGFARLADYAQKGIHLTIDPVFFRERAIAFVPTVVFALEGREVRLTGFTNLKHAARYGAKKTDDAAMRQALKAFAGDAP